MANSSVPSGQFPAYESQKQQQQLIGGGNNNNGAQTNSATVPTGFVDTAFVNNGQVKLAINPFDVGQNNFQVSFIGTDGKPVSNVESATIKMTETDKGIGPLTIDLKKQSDGIFTSDAAFGVAGTWNAIIEGVRSQGSDMIATFDLTVKPAVTNLGFSTKEYKTPDQSLPLYPVFDQARQSIWVGDTLPGTGRIWQFNVGTGNYTLHNVRGTNIITQSVLASDGSIWFVDPLGTNSTGKGTLGNFNPDNNSTKLFEIPEDGVPSGIALDSNCCNLWIPVVQANKVVKFDVSNQKFSSYNIPTPGAGPVGVASDNQGNVWIAESAVGKIGKVNATSGNITEYAPTGKNQTLNEPTAIFADPKSSDIYISEHEGHRITAFSPLFGTFRQYPSVDSSGLPFGMAMDSYGNLWYAEHTIDKIGVLDPRTGQGTEAKVPITGSFIQYLTSDDKGKIWFAAQRNASLGLVTTIAKPSTAAPQPSAGSVSGQQQQSANGTSSSSTTTNNNGVQQLGFSFVDAAGPGIAIGIVLSALAYAKSSIDLKRNLRLAQRLGNR
jgi:copper transport protein